MNLIGSYRALKNNSKSAMIAAIEIYNKPQSAYRNECFCILLVNAWELLLKAILSKHKQKIFYPKLPHQLHKSFSLSDALAAAKIYFPAHIAFEPINQNITILSEYRNHCIHFYNQPGFEVVIFGLAQTSIVNYRDLMLAIFHLDISNEMNLSLLPLSLGAQPDPIQFLQKAKENPPKSRVIAEFVQRISQITQQLEADHSDTGRFLSIFKVNLESTKKVSSADVIVGVQPSADDSMPVYIDRRIDPNISHTETTKSVLQKIGNSVDGIKFGPYQFQAIVWKYDIKNKPHLCWQAASKVLTLYSPELISFIRKLSSTEIETAVQAYREDMRKRQKARKAN